MSCWGGNDARPDRAQRPRPNHDLRGTIFSRKHTPRKNVKSINRLMSIVRQGMHAIRTIRTRAFQIVVSATDHASAYAVKCSLSL